MSNAPSGSIVNNSLPANVCFTRANKPVGTTYSTKRQNSDFDDVLWFRNSSTDKYYVEVEYLALMPSTSDYVISARHGREGSTQNGTDLPTFASNPTINSSYNYQALNSFTDYYTQTNYEGIVTGHSGRLQKIMTKVTYQNPQVSSSSEAFSFGFFNVYSEASGQIFLTGSDNASSSSNTVKILKKHVKITKIA